MLMSTKIALGLGAVVLMSRRSLASPGGLGTATNPALAQQLSNLQRQLAQIQAAKQGAQAGGGKQAGGSAGSMGGGGAPGGSVGVDPWSGLPIHTPDNSSILPTDPGPAPVLPGDITAAGSSTIDSMLKDIMAGNSIAPAPSPDVISASFDPTTGLYDPAAAAGIDLYGSVGVVPDPVDVSNITQFSGDPATAFGLDLYGGVVPPAPDLSNLNDFQGDPAAAFGFDPYAVEDPGSYGDGGGGDSYFYDYGMSFA